MTEEKTEVNELKCQICNKPKSKCIDFNDYYGSCEECLG